MTCNVECQRETVSHANGENVKPIGSKQTETNIMSDRKAAIARATHIPGSVSVRFTLATPE